MSTDLLTDLATQTGEFQAVAEDEEEGWDLWLLVTTLILVGFGLVMIYSASAVMAEQKFDDHLYLVKEQVTKVGIGLVCLVGALSFNYRWYKRLIYPILGVTVVVLGLVLVPGVGVARNGAQRWVSLGGLSFQPAEIVKVVTVMFMAYSVSKKGDKMRHFVVAFVPHFVVIGLLVALLMQQPDFGTSVILLAIMGLMLFVSGAKLTHLTGFMMLGLGGAYLAIKASPYRMDRLRAFFDPMEYRQGIGYQLSESLIAIGSGGLSGRGLGNGTGKLGYVPEL